MSCVAPFIDPKEGVTKCPLSTGRIRMLATSAQGLRSLQLRERLLDRVELLQTLLAEQVQTLPWGNESWLDTERELVAVEQALERIPAVDA